MADKTGSFSQNIYDSTRIDEDFEDVGHRSIYEDAHSTSFPLNDDKPLYEGHDDTDGTLTAADDAAQRGPLPRFPADWPVSAILSDPSAQSDQPAATVPFKVNDIVWVKSKIRRNWPAIVQGVLPQEYRIKYFGDHEYDIIRERDLIPELGFKVTPTTEKPTKKLEIALTELAAFHDDPHPAILEPTPKSQRRILQSTKVLNQPTKN